MNDVPDAQRRLARHIRNLRRDREWSASRLAQRMRDAGVDWTASVIANIESGRRRYLTVGELYALATVFGVKAKDLLDCPACRGEPVDGFACLTCGTRGDQ